MLLFHHQLKNDVIFLSLFLYKNIPNNITAATKVYNEPLYYRWRGSPALSEFARRYQPDPELWHMCQILLYERF